VLLDPLEEKLDLPAAFVQIADRKGRLRRHIGQKYQGFPGFGVPEAHPPEIHRVVSLRIMSVQVPSGVG
jgi:hypothetical protein